MALKRLKVKMTTPGPQAGDIPTVTVVGDMIAQYLKADAQLKAAKAVMEDLRPEILEVGKNEVFSRSCDDPNNPTPTVKLQDEGGDTIRVEFTKKYSVIPDVDALEQLFDDINADRKEPLDINDFVQEAVVAKFDDKVFYDPEGTFQQKTYDAFRKAIEEVAKRLNVPCPLETSKVVTPKEVFHQDRFRVFPDVEVQFKLDTLMPNTTRLVPVPVKK